jgi:hypothetical protein
VTLLRMTGHIRDTFADGSPDSLMSTLFCIPPLLAFLSGAGFQHHQIVEHQAVRGLLSLPRLFCVVTACLTRPLTMLKANAMSTMKETTIAAVATRTQ